ncbi:MAG TPA: phosphatase PAP2 family protein [Bacteroidales bacterium]|nr:phosphatase PAP2 family protein [Bacteroidales bacterium]
MENIDKELFLFLNGLNRDGLDQIVFFISSHWFWLPVVTVILVLIIRKYKKHAWLPILVIIFTYIFTEQVTNFVKYAVERFRPTHNTDISHLVHIVNNYKGGVYGFFSGHAANSFGLALISALFIKNKYYTIAIILWAIIVSYSRIYLGVHYPSDIFAGALFGVMAALIFYRIWKILCHKLIKSVDTKDK